jgi:hypothetical protein
MKALSTFGCCLESEWPYNPEQFAATPPASATASALRHHVNWYYRIDGLETLKLCLAESFPVVGGFSLPASIDTAACRNTGLVRFPGPREKFIGGHAVLFVGYNDATQLLTFKNSWGTGWGDGGFGYLPYAFVTGGLASDFWTIRSADL